MKLEDQVCNLDLSIKLKSLNVKQESLFYWTIVDKNYSSISLNFDSNILYIINHDEVYINSTSNAKSKLKEAYSAFTASELLEMLPKSIEGDVLSIIYYDNSYHIQYSIDGYDGSIFMVIKNEKLINACAKMLIYLIENGLMEIPK